ncbi:WG repeat-containing protein [Chlorogloea sp. CCALA 695]|uniref:WG repeat-containing protein n=1 Tax=Chlorogloea sp. CCALA 695 TaxID=2107693 RepID=UPI001304926F|nr:WG repeat-containing protein [Chlorogloea sp. CCALA 695]
MTCSICVFVLNLLPSTGLTQTEVPSYGYIDKTGKSVIKPQFKLAYKFSEGLARVKIGDKWGYVNKTGKQVIRPQFATDADDVYGKPGSFFNGLAAVKVGNKWGYINKQGQLAIKPKFSTAENFSEGLAVVTFGNKLGYINQ